jgi:hypothetical protein
MTGTRSGYGADGVGVTAGGIGVGVTSGVTGMGVTGIGVISGVTGVGATVGSGVVGMDGSTGDGTVVVAAGSGEFVDESEELAANAGTAMASATAVPASANTRGFFGNGTSLTRGPAVAGSPLTPSHTAGPPAGCTPDGKLGKDREL